MDKIKSVGLIRMRKESGERRVFLPDFVQHLTGLGFQVYVEEGYGSRSGYSFDDYCSGNPLVKMCSREEAFQKDYVLVLRSPTLDEFPLIGEKSCLISMLHFATRPKRVKLLTDLEINAISLDSIVDDFNVRLIENMKAVAWNGLEAAFDILEKRWPGLIRPEKKPFKVLVMGTGMVGKHAADAGTKLGNIERNNEHINNKGSGAFSISIGRNITHQTNLMKGLFQDADILVDAVQRRDCSKPVVPNEWIDWLPEHAVIADLSVDPYTLDAIPPVVRGVEGIPQGSLDQYKFVPDDPIRENQIPLSIPKSNRRAVVSCYSWPGIHPEACMNHYAHQLLPLFEVLATRGYTNLSKRGNYFERSLYRGTLKAFLETEKILHL